MAAIDDSEFFRANPEALTAFGAGGDDVPLPPYQLKDCTFLMLGARFDRSQLATVVPSQLRLAEETTGGFTIYSAQSGWGIAPFSAAIAWVDVDSHRAPDGSKARLIIAGYYSGRAARVFERLGPDEEGSSRQEAHGDLIVGTGGPVGADYLRLTIQPGDRTLPMSSGVHHYLRVDKSGDLNMLPVAFSRAMRPAEPISAEILAPQGTRLRSMVPTRLTWAARVTDMVITLGGATRLGDIAERGREESQTVFLTLLARLGLAAILVGTDSTIRFMSDKAREVLGDGLLSVNGRLKASVRGDQPLLRTAIARAVDGAASGVLEPIAIQRRNGKHPLLIHVFPFGSGARSRGNGPSTVEAALLVVIDPDKRVASSPETGLRLLGLTRAQSVTAAIVGAGFAPRQAADRLGLSEATVRTTLNQIYARLGLSRQSELALLVARVASLGS